MTKDPARLPRPQFPHDPAKAVRKGRHVAPALRGGLCTGHSWHPAASRSPEKRSHAGAVAGPGQEPGSEALPQLSATRMGLGGGAGGGRVALPAPCDLGPALPSLLGSTAWPQTIGVSGLSGAAETRSPQRRGRKQNLSEARDPAASRRALGGTRRVHWVTSGWKQAAQPPSPRHMGLQDRRARDLRCQRNPAEGPQPPVFKRPCRQWMPRTREGASRVSPALLLRGSEGATSTQRL